MAKQQRRAWCKKFAGEKGAATNVTNAFTVGELGAVLATTKSDQEFTSSTHSLPFSASENILNGDKVFFLSAEEAENAAYGFTNDTARVANYGASAGVWWLRSPYADNSRSAGAVNHIGDVSRDYVHRAWAARPAFNLNLDSVLFTSAAAGGKIPAAGGGGNQGGEAADAIFEIPTTTTSEWKLTLLDSSRNFAVTETTAIGKSGDTITLNYTGATTGTNEYISVIIADNEGAKYYGRITQPTSESGTVDVKIPANLAEGSYTLSVFSEQYNGGENDDTKLTDYASAFKTVALTVGNTGPTLTAGAVSRTSDTEATVKFTSSEAGTCYYAVVESGAAAPTIDTSGAGTACAAAEQTISFTSLTAGAKDIYIVVKDAAGNVSSALKIEIPAYVAPVYSISADTTTLNFGSVQTGYTTPAAQTITVTNTGNQQITLTQPTASNYTIGALSKADLAVGETATFTVQPKSGLAAGTYNERITVKGASGGNSTNEISISANFTVQSHKPFNFTDVPQIPGNWKYESIKYVYDRGIMGGVGGSSQFQPDHPLTRAMFATVLYRMAGEPETGYSSRFSDVKAGQWYSSAILWASSKGIVQGYSDGSYGINHNITREQIAKMLYLYGESRGYDVSGASSLEAFTDIGEVNRWAVGFLQWAVHAKMISGKPNGDGSFRLDPKGQATRAECAKMLRMFLEKYDQ